MQVYKLVLRCFILSLALFATSCSDRSTDCPIQNADSLNIYFNLADDINKPRSIRVKSLDRINQILKLSDDDSIKMINLFKVANRQWNMNDFSSYKNTVINIEKFASSLKDSLNIAKASLYLHDYYNSRFLIDSAFYYILKSRRIYKKHNDVRMYASTLIALSAINQLQKNFHASESHLIEVLKLESNHKILKPFELVDVYIMLGNIAIEHQNYDTALTYFEKAQANIVENELCLTSSIYNNVGTIYINKKQYSEAIRVFKLGLACNSVTQHIPTYTKLRANLIQAMYLHDSKSVSENEFMKEIRICDSLSELTTKAYTTLNLAKYYLSIGDSINAKQYGKASNTVAKSCAAQKYQLDALEFLATLDNRYVKSYINFVDSIRVLSYQNKERFNRIEFETEELEKANLKLREEKSSLQLTSILSTSILVLTLIFIFYLYRRLQIVRSSEYVGVNQEIYHLMSNEGNRVETGKQMEKLRISRELHDGVMGAISQIRLRLTHQRKDRPYAGLSEIDKNINDLRKVEDEIRAISHDLIRTRLFSDSSFTALVQSLYSVLKTSSGCEFIFVADDAIDWDLISIPDKMHIYRILQEALQNILKHASATSVELKILKEGYDLLITVEDDGKGVAAKMIKGFGFYSMSMRASNLNGSLRAEASSKGGIKVILHCKNMLQF